MKEIEDNAKEIPVIWPEFFIVILYKISTIMAGFSGRCTAISIHHLYTAMSFARA